jgi:universal stress protein A
VLGSVAETVLRASPVPVLLLRAEPQAAPEAEPGAQRLAAPVRPQTPERPAPPIRNILCPVDFSQNADEAMEHAGTLARRFHARLTVLHVVYNPLDITGSHIPHPPLEQLREEMIRAAEQGLRERVHQNLRGVREAQTVVVAGPPFEQIVRYARAHEVDLIVMGTQGLSGLDHLIMGSTAERVIRTAPCPVLTIRAAA